MVPIFMPIVRLSRRQFDVFFYLVEYFDAPLNQLINGFMHQGRELDTERDIVKISL
jgi:hypothetical protein